MSNVAVIECVLCREVVYPASMVLTRHDFQRTGDGRFRWRSMDFDVVVHECDPAFAGRPEPPYAVLPLLVDGEVMRELSL